MPGDLDFVSVVGCERGLQAGLLPVGKVFLPGSQQSLTTWKASSTAMASSNWSLMAFL